MPAKTKTPPRPAPATRASSKREAARAAAMITALRDTTPPGTPATVAAWRGSVQAESGNGKTGKILTTYSHPATCPKSCPLYGADRGPDGLEVDRSAECYAAAGHWTRIHWMRTADGLTWWESLAAIRAARATMARGNVAGDIINRAGRILKRPAVEWAAALSQDGTRTAWTYTHHQLTPGNVAAIRAMLAVGLVVNVSASTPEEAFDIMRRFPDLPVATVTPGDAPRVMRDADGRRIITCPAESSGRAVTCQSCGGGRPLCARAGRDYAVGFPVHGSQAGKGEARMRAATARAAGVTA
jgi:hypothetical protein